MARREDLHSLNAMVQIRAAQMSAADARAAAAQRAAADAERELAEQQDLQTDRARAWAVVVSSARMDLILSQVWAEALVVGEGDVAQASADVAEAEARRDLARREAYMAQARHEAVDGLAVAAGRRARRLKDEASLLEAADRFQRRREGL